MRMIIVLVSVLIHLVGAASWANAQPQYPRADLSNVVKGPVYTYDWPDGQGNDVSYGASSVGISENGQFLYIPCNVNNARRGIATFQIPTSGTQLTVVKGCSGPDLTQLRQIHPDPNATTPQIGGVAQVGGRMLVTGVITYDAGGSTDQSHWSGTTLDNLVGPFRGTVKAGMVKGSIGKVPSEWIPFIGGPAFSVADYDSIISRASYTPAITTYNPADVITDNFQMNLLMGCPHDIVSCQSYVYWGPATPSFEGSELGGGAAFIPGTRTVVFVEREGLGTPPVGSSVPHCGYGYPTTDINLHGTDHPGTDDALWIYSLSDPPDKGPKCYPYRLVAKAVDVNDLVAVKNGTMLASDVRPYEMVVLPTDATDPNAQQLLGGTFDPVKGRYYLAYSAHGGINTIHTLDFGTTQTTPPTGTITANPTIIVAGDSTNVCGTSSDATSGTLSPGGDGLVPVASWCLSKNPPATTSYTATYVGPGGSFTTQAVTVTVTVPPPPTGTFTATPTTTAVAGDPSVLFWNIIDATTADIDQGIGIVSPGSGSLTVNPVQTTVYTLSATGPGGQLQLTATVNVTETCGDGIDNDLDGSVDEGCQPPDPVAPDFQIGATQCQLSLGSNPPDATGGWVAQFQLSFAGAGDWRAYGTPDSTVPYGRMQHVDGGFYEGRIIWTKGNDVRISLTTPVNCQ